MKAALTVGAIAFGGTSVVLLMVVSVVDSASRAMGAPVLGAKELSEAFLVICVAAALPMSVLGGRTVTIDGVVAKLPGRIRLAVSWAGIAMAILAMAALGWRLVGASADARDFEETSALLLIPYAPLYLVLAVGHAAASVAFLIHSITSTSDTVPGR